MKSLIPGVIVAALFVSSCSTVYRTEQTPDDVYFSPAKQESRAYAQSSDNNRGNDGYVDANSGRDDGRRYRDENYSGYDDYANADDRWLMMRVRNPYRWSMFDDYGYGSPYNSFGYGGFGGFGGGPYASLGYNNFYPGFGLGVGYGLYDPFMSGYGFNSYYNWNTYYNPYYSHIVVINPKTNPAGYTRVRNFNPGLYSNSSNATGNRRAPLRPNYNGYVRPDGRRLSNGSNNSTLGGSFRRMVSPNNARTNNNSSYDRPVRTYNPSYNNSNNSPAPRSSGGYSGGSSSGGNSSGGSSSGGRPHR